MGAATRNRARARLDAMAELRDHFASGAHACPYARSRSNTYTTTRSMMAELERHYHTSGAALVVVPEYVAPGFDAFRAWGLELFLTLFRECQARTHPDALAKLCADARRMIYDPLERRIPFAQFELRWLYAIAMGPAYPATHPRYAPRPCMVITWHDDVSELIGTPVSLAIRERMEREHGSVYGADSIVLPLPPAQVT